MVLLKRQMKLVIKMPNSLINPRSFIAAPDMPPVNITATAVSSTEIEVVWEEVPAISHNGEVTMYEVIYDPIQTFDVLAVNTVNITNTSMLFTVLTGLEEYVEYNISVRAYTSTGPGPYSDPVTVRTDTDSKTHPGLELRHFYFLAQIQMQLHKR